jgi:hypothetical protein
MLLHIVESELGKSTARCVVGTGIIATELIGKSISHLKCTGGLLRESHLEWIKIGSVSDDKHEGTARLLCENALDIVSENGLLEVCPASFAFSGDLGEESEITVRFIPKIDAVASLPSFIENFKHVRSRLQEFGLHNGDEKLILAAANRLRLLPELSIPIKFKSNGRWVDAVLKLEIRAGLASIASFRIFCQPEKIGKHLDLFQFWSDATKPPLGVGAIENLMVFRT